MRSMLTSINLSSPVSYARSCIGCSASPRRKPSAANSLHKCKTFYWPSQALRVPSGQLSPRVPDQYPSAGTSSNLPLSRPLAYLQGSSSIENAPPERPIIYQNIYFLIFTDKNRSPNSHRKVSLTPPSGYFKLLIRRDSVGTDRRNLSGIRMHYFSTGIVFC